MEAPRGTYFAVFYDKMGNVIRVVGPDGQPAEKKKLSTNPLQNVNGLTCCLVVHKRGKSPCCFVINDWEWCWC